MTYSKSVNFILAVVSFFLLLPSPIKSSEGNTLLSADDLSHEASDHKRGPALSSAVDDPNPWETYNQWMCFNATQVQVESVGVKTNKIWKPWPQITITTLGQRFEVSPATDRALDTEAILTAWETLINQAREVCFYAAFLQYFDSEKNEAPRSLWVLEALKTEAGYWRESEN